jgi:hypothetical protein
MSAILELLASQLDDNAIAQIAGQLGVDNKQAQQAITAAAPLLLGALDREAQSADGAQALNNALDRDHNGAIFNDLMGALASPDTASDGAAILGHVLGGNLGQMEQGVSQISGLDQDSTGQLLNMLAPVVLGAVGKEKEQLGAGAAGLTQMLDGELAAADAKLPGFAKLFDMDGDGQVTDDVKHWRESDQRLPASARLTVFH